MQRDRPPMVDFLVGASFRCLSGCERESEASPGPTFTYDVFCRTLTGTKRLTWTPIPALYDELADREKTGLTPCDGF